MVEMKLGWKIVVGTVIGFFGAAFGTVGGVGGGGIFVPMLTLIIGLRHPTLDLPLIDYDLALLFQPMLVLGISIGVAFNEAARRQMQSNGDPREEVEYKPLPGGPSIGTPTEIREPKRTELPVAFGVTIYEAVNLYTGRRVIASKGESNTDWKVHQLVLYSACGIIAGIVGGLLGLGGGFILGPVFLELGIPPQVSSATATFAMTFSASMSVIEYYLLHRFPVPYALYLAAVATLSAIVGQHVVRKVVMILGRASIIIFILAFTIFVSAISLGGVGIADMVEKIEHKEYMGFENICTYDA
ncbi:Sulfite exporter TauE/SafE family protein [Prunus dulcis]|uniref:Sulfite exporter TauE/SafE family protein n=1 Tax=Prunus dulcis TaxID=3755 RepID=A0A4Y1R4C5_PRUDU|nr:Sulfite exporter TauE/SafE family protein [Prunus dulcis]